MKKITALAVLLIIVTANLASCSRITEGFAFTTNMLPQQETETTEKNIIRLSEEGSIKEDEELLYQDNKTYKLGSYVSLVFNPEFCDIEYSVKSGLGTSEDVKIEVKMKDGYYFDCFTESNYYPNIEYPAQVLSETNVLEKTFSDETCIYLNYSQKIYYDLDYQDDESASSVFIYKYPVSYYKCPKTITGSAFKRDGYTLTGYSQSKDDYSSFISVGSRFLPESVSPYLYCVWEKQNDISDFVFEKQDGYSVLVKYTGTSEKVVVPDEYEGLKVERISKEAITNNDVEYVILPNTIKTLDDGFLKSQNLESISLYDSVEIMYDSLLSDCPNLKHLRINTMYAFYNSWGIGTYNKYDRLLWAKDKKKIVICGGSGTWYGFDCEKMTEEFGDEYVIINMGMNANMCSCALIEGISAFLNEDDVFLWSPEPITRVLGDVKFDDKTWWFTSGDYGIFEYIDISQYKNVFSTFASFNVTHAKNQKSDIWVDKNESIYGDNITPRENEVSFVTYNSYSVISKGYIHEIFGKMKETGVKMLLTYPAMAKDQPGTDNLTLLSNENALKSSFDFEYISEYDDCLYDISYFYNSEWHMTNEGAKVRTENVIKDLKKYLENN